MASGQLRVHDTREAGAVGNAGLKPGHWSFGLLLRRRRTVLRRGLAAGLDGGDRLWMAEEAVACVCGALTLQPQGRTEPVGRCRPG